MTRPCFGMTLSLLLFAVAPVTVADEPTLTPAEYMGAVRSLQNRWQRAGKYAYGGLINSAIAVLEEPRPDGLGPVWIEKDKARRDELTRMRARSLGLSTTARRGIARWLQLAANPERSIQLYQSLENGHAPEADESLWYYGLALIELDRCAEAADCVDAQARRSTSYRTLYEERAAFLRKRAEGKIDDATFFREYCLSSMGMASIPFIVRAYDKLRPLEDCNDRELIASMFRRCGDKVGSQVFLESIARDAACDGGLRAGALLQLGNDAAKAEDLDMAARCWHELIERYPGTESWPKGVYNLAITLKGQGRYDEAITEFQRLRDAEVNDREAGADLMEPYRNYRPKAAWEIGLCLLATGDAAGALSAFHLTRDKYPFQSWCGNEIQAAEHRYIVYEGICREYLGQYDLAVKAYFDAIVNHNADDPFANMRLVAIYEAAGQISVLGELCDAADEHYRARLRRVIKDASDDLLNRIQPTAVTRKLIEVRRCRERKDLECLIRLFEEGATHRAPDTLHELHSRWLASEAARALASYPEVALPQLLDKTGNAEDPKVYWYYIALGFNGSPKAVELLASRLAETRNVHRARSIRLALLLAGPHGEAALKELEQSPGHSLIETQGKYLRYVNAVGGREPPDLPEIPGSLHLPQRWTDVSEEARVLNELPARVDVRVGSPQQAVESWVMALRLADRAAYAQLIKDERLLWRAFDSLTQSSDGNDVRLMTHEILSCQKEGDYATVCLKLSPNRRRSVVISVRLELSESQWRIVRLSEGCAPDDERE